MRRFDLKVEFLPLAPEPLRDLLKAVLPERDHARLATIPTNHLASRRVTPGNVRTALDQLDLRGLPLRLNTLMDALTLEEREQHGQRQPMPFIADEDSKRTNRQAQFQQNGADILMLELNGAFRALIKFRL
ncbi:hypothetical protein HLB35_00235 [Halomonas sp. TBZ9]|uniref:Uncharacterized protein n=1 Tax=Vreelandella azerica TaxID=2732867 RepID=A0A7Y3TVD6_9GAMM|nr:hypothetical protein [Halomonas azerica]NOG30588.1 hypothetical protein [Halomonas azerica]